MTRGMEATGHEEENTPTKEAHHDKICPSPARSREPRISIASFASGDSSTKMFMQTIKDKEAACPKLGLSRVVRAGSVAPRKAALAAGEKVAATARRVDDLQGLNDRYRDQVLLLPLDVTNETQAIEAYPYVRCAGSVLILDRTIHNMT
jgi:hypothetical protein